MTERAECHRLRGALAMRALGRADELDVVLDDHLDRCADCRAELRDLTDAARGLLLVDPAASPDTTHPSIDLPHRILAQVDAGRQRRRRRRVLAIAAALVMALTGVGFAISSLGSGPTSEAAPPIELRGADAHGTARLTAREWGTEVALATDGLRAGEVYWLWLTDADGQRVGAGTITGTGAPMEAVLASALPESAARRIWLTDEADAVVLDARIPGD